MDSENERFAYAQWILERNLHWVGAAEVKTGVIVTLNVAMLGGLAAAFTGSAQHTYSGVTILFFLLGAGCLLISLYCAGMSVIPRVSGPKTSYIFFGRIAATSRPDYVDTFKRADRSALLDDCLDQIHRNAEIARDKFQWVRAAMCWSFASVVPWVSSVASVLRT